MKKLAFIDHSFKKQSLSSSFLIDLFREDYEVSVFWDESCSGGSRVDLRQISEGCFDVLILFQQMSYYAIEELKSLNCSVILIPMYDAERTRSENFWYKYRDFKFINFSRTIHERLENIGIDSLYCQYFPSPPVSGIAEVEGQGFSQLKGFFWQRTGDVTWNLIKKLIGQTKFASIHIHTAVDPPGYDLVLPSEEDQSVSQITTSEWFESKEGYIRKVSESYVYFAPRLYEGIGMAFLEAMALGKCVVAPNHPTMNEYITHGCNGLLYDPVNPQALDFSNLEEICLNARSFIEEGFANWSVDKQRLINFIAQPKKRRFPPLSTLKRRLNLHFESRKIQ